MAMMILRECMLHALVIINSPIIFFSTATVFAVVIGGKYTDSKHMLNIQSQTNTHEHKRGYANE